MKCPLKAIPCIFVVQQMYGWFLHKDSPLEFFLREKTSLLWPLLYRPWPFCGPPASRRENYFWLLLLRCCFLCLLAQTSQVRTDASLTTPPQTEPPSVSRDLNQEVVLGQPVTRSVFWAVWVGGFPAAKK